MYNAPVSSLPLEVCPACAGTGWVRASHDGVEGVVRCDCLKNSRFVKLLENARIPKRYEHCELDIFESVKGVTTPSIELAKIAAEKFVEEYPMSPPLGLLFVGPQGVGKTHLAVGTVKKLMREKNVPCLFRTFPELLKEIQNSYNPISQASELSLLSPVLEVEVLVLDELGAQTPSSWVRDTVSYVLNYRYNENKVTILTTNYLDHDEASLTKAAMPDSLTQRIGDRMRSRLYEMCKKVEMPGKDFRKEVKGAEHHFKRRDA